MYIYIIQHSGRWKLPWISPSHPGSWAKAVERWTAGPENKRCSDWKSRSVSKHLWKVSSRQLKQHIVHVFHYVSLTHDNSRSLPPFLSPGNRSSEHFEWYWAALADGFIFFDVLSLPYPVFRRFRRGMERSWQVLVHILNCEMDWARAAPKKAQPTSWTKFNRTYRLHRFHMVLHGSQ